MKSHGLEMVGPISSSDGVDAITIEAGTGKVEVATDIDITGTVKIESGSPGAGRVLESDASGYASWTLKSVPSGEIILFEKDTAVTGYTLLTSVDDGVVYITKGSAAAGETGGTAKSGGTWTQPNHTHTGPSHTHNSGSHTHTVDVWASNQSGTVLTSSTYALEFTDGSDTDWRSINAGSSFTRRGKRETTAAGSGSTAADGTGATGGSATANTWRPTGRNFTRQQKT